MLEVNKATASNRLGVDKIFIQFTIKDTTESLSNYKFTLLKSNFPDDNFTPIIDHIEEFECFDYDINLYNADIHYFYKIRITNLITGEKRDSFVFGLNETLDDEYGFYLSELYSIYLDAAINNSPMILLKKKRTGEICGCFDDIRNTSRASKCTNCFNAKYSGGYYNPVDIRVCFLNAPVENERMDHSGIVSDDTPIQMWTGNYPIIQQGDILVDKVTGTRFIVTTSQQSLKNKTTLRQTLQIDRIPESDVIYKLKIEGVR